VHLTFLRTLCCLQMSSSNFDASKQTSQAANRVSNGPIPLNFNTSVLRHEGTGPTFATAYRLQQSPTMKRPCIAPVTPSTFHRALHAPRNPAAESHALDSAAAGAHAYLVRASLRTRVRVRDPIRRELHVQSHPLGGKLHPSQCPEDVSQALLHPLRAGQDILLLLLLLLFLRF
jgi:hypothetical protein